MTGRQSTSAPWVLALDVGSSSVRSAWVDERGRLLGDSPVARIAYRWVDQPPGAMVIDPDLLLGHVVAVLDAAVERGNEQGLTPLAVASSVFWHSTMGIGADGRPVTPLFGWGDERAAGAAARLRTRLDPAAVHRRTGCYLDPTYPAARLLWLREVDSAIFAPSVRWISFGEYVELRLCGVLRCSLSMASATGLFDGERIAWDAEVLDAIGVSADALSPLVDASDAATVSPGAARRWPMLAGVPWYPPLGDGACANLGVGAIDGRRGVTVGTTAALRALVRSTAPISHPQLWSYRLDGARTVVGRALSNGGNAIAALERVCRLPPRAEWDAALAAEPPDGHGLTILPWLVGERGPGAPGAGAVVQGLTTRTRPVELLRAWMEAIALRVGELVRTTNELLGTPDELLAGGGALYASTAWRQILADVTGTRIVLPATPESAVRGVALLALESAGVLADAAAVPPPPAAVAEPVAEHLASYMAAEDRQHRLARALRPSG